MTRISTVNSHQYNDSPNPRYQSRKTINQTQIKDLIPYTQRLLESRNAANANPNNTSTDFHLSATKLSMIASSSLKATPYRTGGATMNNNMTANN